MKRLAKLSIAAGACVASVGLVDTASVVHAASVVTVTRFDDPAPGPCATSGTGSCSLREAVIFANAHNGTTVNLPAGAYVLSRSGADSAAMSGDLDIHADTAINGAGPEATTISGGNLDRVFDVYPPSQSTSTVVSIGGVTVKKGLATDGFGGGGIWVGDGAGLTLTHAVVEQNGTIDHQGGGIMSRGPTTHLTLIESTVRVNNAYTTGQPGLDARGGGIAVEDSSVTIDRSAVVENVATAAPGGASNSQIGGGDTEGGGVWASGAATVTILNSVVATNTANAGPGNPGPGSEATGGNAWGGGLAGSFTGGRFTVVNTTITATGPSAAQERPVNTAPADSAPVVGSTVTSPRR